MVDRQTTLALKRLKETGRHLILVTGRLLADLQRTYSDWELFTLIVAENGATLYEPSTDEQSAGTETVLADPPPPEFAELLKRRGVAYLEVGKVIVSSLEEYKEIILETIAELGLELQIIFNKGSVMVLPSGINKAIGLQAASKKLGVSLHNVVGVGDAENDHAFLKACERSVAVANALPSLKERSDLILNGDDGEGVAELVARLIENDLADVPARESHNNGLLLGAGEDGEVRLPFYGSNVLVAGTSGGGKSTLTTGVMEQLTAAQYQFLVIDPEGDYQAFEGAIVLGDAKRPPTPDEIIQALEQGRENLITNLLGVHADDRPDFFERLLPRIQELRSRTGRPHWVILDEAHHLMPAARELSRDALAQALPGAMFITLQPDHLPEHVLASIDNLVTVGDKPQETVAEFCQACRNDCPKVAPEKLEKGTALFWSRGKGETPRKFTVHPCRTQLTRHSRKYSSAELTPDRSFYFRGPEGKLNLRASNLITFVRLLEGVDDDTWLHHLQAGGYSDWFRKNIKSDELADAAKAVEENGKLSAAESRNQIKEEIEQRFTLPA